MYYIFTHHFYCAFCQMKKKHRRQKSYGSGMHEGADELVCEFWYILKINMLLLNEEVL